MYIILVSGLIFGSIIMANGERIKSSPMNENQKIILYAFGSFLFLASLFSLILLNPKILFLSFIPLTIIMMLSSNDQTQKRNAKLVKYRSKR